MKPYRNVSGDAGILAYDFGSTWIRVRFSRGGIYKYTADRIGRGNVKTMIKLAEAGDGLTTFINTHEAVKNGYSSRTVQ